MGIHNEPGYKKVSPIPKADELIKSMVETLTSTTDPDRSYVKFKNDGTDRVVLMVNNLGGMSELELSGITGHATTIVSERGYKVERVLSGTFITSLNMPGFSITLLRLPDGKENAPASDKEILEYIDYPVNVPGWRWHANVSPRNPEEYIKNESESKSKSNESSGKPIKIDNSQKVLESIKAAAQNLINAEPEITKLDTVAGDGDCGLTLKAGAEGVLKRLENGQISGDDITSYILNISEVAENDMGGTSGALYSIFFSALAGAVRSENDIYKSSEIALNTLYKYTRARPPSRTLIDALDAFVRVYSQTKDAKKGIEEAKTATDKGKNMEARAGRAACKYSYNLI